METLLLDGKTEDLEKAAQIIKDGGVVGVPTETVYGLAADALNGAAVKRIFEAKGRPADNPLIVHIKNIDDIDRYSLVSEIPDKAKALMKKFWPGPLTIIMKKGENVPDEVTAGLSTVAVRFPSHETVRRIMELSDRPLAAPSANISGRPSPTAFSHVVNDMYGKIEAIVDGGDCSVGVESTVITMVTDVPRILRPGYITPEDISSVIGDVEVDKAVLNQIESNEKVASPGMKYKHYSPRAKVILLRGESEKFIDYVNSKDIRNLAVICYDEEADRIDAATVTEGRENDLEEQMRRVFDALRKVDRDDIDVVYAHCPKAQGIGMALYNRLIRAAGFEVIDIE